jgi:hypothetical protein
VNKLAESGRGMKLVGKAASSFDYQPVLGLNRTLIPYRR